MGGISRTLSVFPGALGHGLGVRAAVAVVLIGLAAQTLAQPAREVEEYKLKAAFLLNFARFIQWPAGAFAGPEAPLHVCVCGADPFGPLLDEAVRGERIGAREIAVLRLRIDEPLHACHLAFLPRSEAPHLAAILKRLHGRHTLTVGEMEGFARQGGMINFHLRDDHVRFEINPKRVAEARLVMSSKLLSVAELIGNGPAE